MDSEVHGKQPIAIPVSPIQFHESLVESTVLCTAVLAMDFATSSPPRKIASLFSQNSFGVNPQLHDSSSSPAPGMYRNERPSKVVHWNGFGSDGWSKIIGRNGKDEGSRDQVMSRNGDCGVDQIGRKGFWRELRRDMVDGPVD